MVKTILVLSLFWLSAAVLSPIAILYMLFDIIGLTALVRPVLGVMARAWARFFLRAMGVSVVVSGLENVPDEERLCFVSNHQGDLDIVLMLAFMPRPVGFIAKSEAAWFPFVNLWIAALGSAFIRRKSPRQGKKAIDRGVRNIERGHALVIYPEGTRSRGPTMLPFRKGAFKLATRSEATIVPITIDGTWKAWESHNRIESAQISLVVHPAFPTANLSIEEKKDLPEHIEAVIKSGLSAGGS